MVTATSPPESSSIPIHVQRHLQSTLRGSLMLPMVAMEALEVVKDPRCTIGEFSRIVERDLRLVTEIIAQSKLKVLGMVLNGVNLDKQARYNSYYYQSSGKGDQSVANSKILSGSGANRDRF